METLRLIVKTFYAPRQAMDETRRRVPLGTAAAICVLVQGVLWFVVQASDGRSPAAYLGNVFNALILGAVSIVVIAGVFAPLLLVMKNFLQREKSLRAAFNQDYVALVAALLIAWSAASVVACAAIAVLRVSGVEAGLVEASIARMRDFAMTNPQLTEGANANMIYSPALHRASLALSWAMLPFFVWSLMAMRAALSLSWLRAALVFFAAGATAILTMRIWGAILYYVFAMPLFLLPILFIFGRGYFANLARAQQSRSRFKQNLEAATLNPADASAHYNLGLIHLERKEYKPAQERFQRAIEIDADEADAHYQLGRIARIEKRFADAIKHFEQVVARDPTHAQHEVWREIGATYLDAGQASDAHDALERFTEHRIDDAEGLYLMGRTLAAMGQTHHAADFMRRCIEAVKTAPAYKYQAERRWLNEAENFLRANASQ